MARFARVVVPGCWHHVTQRGNRRQTVFFSDDDRAVYLRLLGLECAHHGVRIAGYCLLSNHVHVVAIPKAEDSMAKAFGRAHVGYARWLNVRRAETGHVWQNRYFSCPLDERHRWEALRYVELNPVRAGLVDAAEKWPWSSAAAHLGGVDAAGLLDLAEWAARWNPAAWRDVLDEGPDSADIMERIREATGTGRTAGSEFIERLEKGMSRMLRPQKRGPKGNAECAGQMSFGDFACP